MNQSFIVIKVLAELLKKNYTTDLCYYNEYKLLDMSRVMDEEESEIRGML